MTAEPVASVSERLIRCAQRLAVAVIDRAAHAAVAKVDDLSDTLEEISQRGGIGVGAAIGGGLATLQGKSPIWGAIQGAASAMSTTTKVVVALLLILAALLAPVVFLVAALVLLVVVVVSAVRNN